MTISLILWILQIVVSIILILLIVLQQRGTMLGSGFGGGGEIYSIKRGLEKKIYYGTIITAIIFFLLGFINLFFV